MPSLCLSRLALILLLTLPAAALPGCGGGGTSDGIAYQGNEEAVRQHMEEVAAEERAHFEATARTEKSTEQRVEEEERAQRQRN